MYIALFCALTIRYAELPTHERLITHLAPFSLVIVVFIASFLIAGLYELASARNNKIFISSLMQAVVASTGIAMMYFYLVRPGITPRLNLALFVMLSVVLVVGWRHVINRFLGSALLVRTLILGTSRDARELAKIFAHNPQHGYVLIACATCVPLPDGYQDPLPDVPIRHSTIEELIRLIRDQRVELVIPASALDLPAHVVQKLYGGGLQRVRVADLPEISEHVAGKVPLQSISTLWFLEHSSRLKKPLYEFAKRIFDIIMAIASLTILLPLSPFIYCAIILDTKGSGFFTQHRVGKGGKIFRAIKFRSMTVTRANSVQTVTRVGKFLRKTRLDELPQLINILKGDMSFVGPRPEQSTLIDSLSATVPFYRERLQVKPGLTGWDQISGCYHSASVEDTYEKLQYDLYYIKNRSLTLDAIILLRTIKTVLSAAGK